GGPGGAVALAAGVEPAGGPGGAHCAARDGHLERRALRAARLDEPERVARLLAFLDRGLEQRDCLHLLVQFRLSPRRAAARQFGPGLLWHGVGSAALRARSPASRGGARDLPGVLSATGGSRGAGPRLS